MPTLRTDIMTVQVNPSVLNAVGAAEMWEMALLQKYSTKGCFELCIVWLMILIPALRGRRQEDCHELEASLVYRVSSGNLDYSESQKARRGGAGELKSWLSG